MRATFRLLSFGLLLLMAASSSAQDNGQAQDEEYTAEIRKHTTDAFFSTPYVDHLPASDTVPTPLKVLGHISGAPNVLSYSTEVHKYMRALADASPRVAVFSGGTSEEGREMILVAVGSEESIANLEKYKDITNKLADPRKINDEEAAKLIDDSKAFYWCTGAMHSPETGSPEMLMELAYRLAVEETPFVQAIRDNVIVLITPVLDVDGRDKRVDLQKLEVDESNPVVPRLLYWGKYVAHDNNRDNMALSLELSKHIARTFMEYKPQVMHDLHESASHLYVSTGTGPYNAWVDPILVDEWHILAYQEVNGMTRLGVPGVWTHDFYDGWAPNYGFFMAQAHNSIGRFYETQGAGSADTRRINSNASREWFRPNPPLASTMWSIRNNVNMQQSGLLIAMNYMANNKQRFMENFYLKSKRSIAKATTEGPAAYVVPASYRSQGQAADLMNLMQEQGVEVHRTTAAVTVGDQEFPAGSLVLRLDQPYSRYIDMMLDTAYYNVNDPRPYDDTGWTLGPLFNAGVVRVESTDILEAEMELIKGAVKPEPSFNAEGDVTAYVIDYNADNRMATFRFQNPQLKIDAAEADFAIGDEVFHAGSFIVKKDGQDGDAADVLKQAADEYGFQVRGVAELPEVATHPLGVPRIAIMHTWTSTQNEGWVRIAFDKNKIPYEYISVHEARDDDNLRDKYDVIVMGPSSSNALSIVDGLPMTGRPIPWKASSIAPNIGKQDETDDMRGGLGLEGVMHLRDFVQKGGVFVAIQDSCSLPVHFGLASGVSINDTQDLRVSGSVLLSEHVDTTSPIGYGFGDTLGVYFRNGPVLSAAGGGGRGGRGGFGGGRGGRGGAGGGNEDQRILDGNAKPTGRGAADEQDRVQGRPTNLGQAAGGRGGRGGRGRGGANAGGGDVGGDNAAAATGGQDAQQGGRGRGGRGRGGRSGANAGGGNAQGGGGNQAARLPARNAVRTVFRFNSDHRELLISGMLVGGDELAGTPAVVDAPLGDGHFVLFAINPMWRGETQGSYPLVFNALLHFDHLHAGTREPEQTDESDNGQDEEEVYADHDHHN